MDMECDFCGKLFHDGDDITANVVSKFKALKSSRVYAIEKPTEVLGMRHYPDCFNYDKDGD